MEHRTISILEYHNDDVVNIKATDTPNRPVNIRAVLAPYLAKGYKLLRTKSNVATGTLVAMFER